MDDSFRQFDITKEELCSLVAEYGRKSFYEDLEAIQSKFGSIKNICSALGTDPVEGLSDQQAKSERISRIAAFGENRLPKRKRASFWELCWDACEDFTLRVLMVCGLVSIVLGVTLGEHPQIEWIEGFAIWVAVIVVILVTASNDYSKEKQFEKLNATKEDRTVTVYRSGRKEVISVFDLYVGDFIYVEMGDEIPADCFVMSADDLRIDESSLTGEPDPIVHDSFDNCLKMVETKAEKIREMREYMQSEDKKHLTAHAHHIVSSPIVLSGTTALSGSGFLLVVAVGESSKSGEMMLQLSTDAETTPLQDKLEKITQDVGKLGVSAAALTLVALILSYWIMWANEDVETRDTGGDVVREHVSFLTIAITIIAVAVPEGLPLAVTISLAYSINKMLKDQNWVRRLQACETMGGANEICSDKTGTLTKNKMTVQAYWNGLRLSKWERGLAPTPEDMVEGSHDLVDANIVKSNARDCGITDASIIHMNKDITNTLLLPGPFASVLMQCIALNSTGFLEIETHQVDGGFVEDIKHNGSPTECALLQFARAVGCDFDTLRKSLEPSVVHREQFTSDRKIMTTIIKSPDNPRLYRVFVKGASERVLALCTAKVSNEGKVVDFVNGEERRIEDKIISPLATAALRTICLAYRDFDPETEKNWKQKTETSPFYFGCESRLVCLGITGIRDPVRDEVPLAVKTCQKAGINVRMVTGDNIETARQIAKACGILTAERNLAMLGKDFYQLIGGVVCANCKTETCDCPRDSRALELKEKDPANADKKFTVRDDILGKPEEFAKIKDTLAVLARSQPSDKYALVTGLRNTGAVVAVTGDGTNDAPALKKADVGFAMGIAGKEVAKQAADIVLLDDNFNSIVQAVKWGRNIYDNIQRFLQFQLTVNVVAVVTAFLCAVMLRGSPLFAIQLLWVNLIMDSLASLALATEPPTDSLLDRLPHSRDDYLITQIMWRSILGHALYQLVVVFVIVFTGERWIPEESDAVEKIVDRVNSNDVLDVMNKMGFTSVEQLVYSPYGDGRTYVISGRHFNPFSNHPVYNEILKSIGPSRCYTVVFNSFVYMQVFNLINARKIHNEINVFDGITRNPNWIAIFFIIAGLQAILVEFGSLAFQCSPAGLSPAQWGICLAFGLSSLLWHVILRIVPPSIFPQAGNKSVESHDTNIAQKLRGSTTSSQFRRQSSLLSGGVRANSSRQASLRA